MNQHPIDHYLIFVRPPMSRTWTQHVNQFHQEGVPWRTSDPDKANREAMNIAEHTHYCVRVVPVRLPAELDEHILAVLADGDSTYVPAEPKEVA